MSNFIMKRGILRTSLIEDDLFRLYKVFREGFVDGKIPIKKIVGFKLSSVSRNRTVTVAARSPYSLENQIEISKNMSSIILTGDSGNIARAKLPASKITGKNINFKANEDSLLEIVDKDIYIMSVIEEVNLDVVIRENTGFNSITDNAKFIKETTKGNFYPMNTNHSLSKYINILPFDGHRIRYTVNNVKEEHLNILWGNYVKGLGNNEDIL